MLSEKEKEELLSIARRTLELYLRGHKGPYIEPDHSSLKQPRGAFVTLHHHMELRGCIGNMVATHPLYQTVQRMAIAAATEDPRFDPVKPDELSDIIIEISVLTPPFSIKTIQEIQIGSHGLIVTKGGRRGVLLPQVATENNWTPEEFLQHTCQKGGLAPDEWKKGGLQIEAFLAEVFGERSLITKHEKEKKAT